MRRSATDSQTEASAPWKVNDRPEIEPSRSPLTRSSKHAFQHQRLCSRNLADRFGRLWRDLPWSNLPWSRLNVHVKSDLSLGAQKGLHSLLHLCNREDLCI